MVKQGVGYKIYRTIFKKSFILEWQRIESVLPHFLKTSEIH